MASDTEQLILSISADTRQISRALKKLEGDTRQTANNISKSFSGVDSSRLAGNVSRSMRSMQADARNLSFQLNDITQGLLTGHQSPFTIMAQQGSQVSQIIVGTGGIVPALRTMGGALSSFLSPAALGVNAAIFAIGLLASKAREYFSEVEDGGETTEKQLEEHKKLIAEIAKEWGGAATPALQAYVDNLSQLDDIAKAEQAQRGELDKVKQSVGALEPELEKILGLFERYPQFSPAIAAMREEMTGFNAKVKDSTVTIADAERLTEALATALERLPLAGARDLAEQFREANRAMRESITHAQELGGVIDNLKAPQFGPPVPEGTLREWQGRLDAAKKLIIDFESFQTKAYGDTRTSTGKFDAWRVGFGSDTFVNDMGEVQRVTKETVVTFEQAMADLERRVPEFQTTIQSQIGRDFWVSLNEQQQAALTSIAYNYGSLPDSIVAAIQKGDRGQVAQAIASLSANPERRLKEAQIYAGGALPAAPKLNEETDAVKQATDAWAGLRDVTSEAGEAASTVGTIGTAAAQQWQQVGSAMQSALTGFVTAVARGEDAGDAFRNMLTRLTDQLLQMTIQSLFAKNALGALFGGIGGGGIGGFSGAAGLYHRGGIVGETAVPHRQVSPAIFAGAPRMHSGGIAGLRPGEYPAILKRGEMVIPNPKRLAGGGSTMIDNSSIVNRDTINIDMSESGYVTANTEDGRKVGTEIQRAVQAILVKESRPGGLLRKRQ